MVALKYLITLTKYFNSFKKHFSQKVFLWVRLPIGQLDFMVELFNRGEFLVFDGGGSVTVLNNESNFFSSTPDPLVCQRGGVPIRREQCLFISSSITLFVGALRSTF